MYRFRVSRFAFGVIRQTLVYKTRNSEPETLNTLMVVGVGIEPTCRAFQARANPSQLSDLKRLPMPIVDC